MLSFVTSLIVSHGVAFWDGILVENGLGEAIAEGIRFNDLAVDNDL